MYVCMSCGLACFCQITGPVQGKELSILYNITITDDTLGLMNSHTCNYITSTGVQGIEFIMLEVSTEAIYHYISTLLPDRTVAFLMRMHKFPLLKY